MTNHLKTLEKMARKDKTIIQIKYFFFTPLTGEPYYRWNGTIIINDNDITVAHTNFTRMLHKLCKEVIRERRRL